MKLTKSLVKKGGKKSLKKSLKIKKSKKGGKKSLNTKKARKTRKMKIKMKGGMEEGKTSEKMQRAFDLYDKSEEIRKKAYENIHKDTNKLAMAIATGLKPWNAQRNKFGNFVGDYSDGIVYEIFNNLDEYEKIE
jgi:hypothetical protein